MIILNSIVSTINIALLMLVFLFWRGESTKAGRYGLAFLIYLLAVNTALIWM